MPAQMTVAQPGYEGIFESEKRHGQSSASGGWDPRPGASSVTGRLLGQSRARSWHRPDARAKMRPVVERCSLGGFTAALAAAVAVCAATAPYADAVHAAGRCRPRPHRPVLGLNVE